MRGKKGLEEYRGGLIYLGERGRERGREGEKRRCGGGWVGV